MLGVFIVHIGDVYGSYSSFGEGFWSKSIEVIWIALNENSTTNRGVLLNIPPSFSKCISFPSLVWTWISSIVVPFDEVDPIVVVDLEKNINEK